MKTTPNFRLVNDFRYLVGTNQSTNHIAYLFEWIVDFRHRFENRTRQRIASQSARRGPPGFPANQKESDVAVVVAAVAVDVGECGVGQAERMHYLRDVIRPAHPAVGGNVTAILL